MRKKTLKIFQAIEVTDVDLIGDILDVRCVPREGFASDACDHFDIMARTRETDHDMFRGSIVLKKPLNFQDRQIYRVPLAVFDGKSDHTVYDDITFNTLGLFTPTRNVALIIAFLCQLPFILLQKCSSNSWPSHMRKNSKTTARNLMHNFYMKYRFRIKARLGFVSVKEVL